MLPNAAQGVSQTFEDIGVLDYHIHDTKLRIRIGMQSFTVGRFQSGRLILMLWVRQVDSLISMAVRGERRPDCKDEYYCFSVDGFSS